MKKIRFYAVMLLIAAGGALFIYAAPADNVYGNIKLFSEVFTRIQDEYVEPVPARKLIYGALKGMVGTLDPFSAFLDTSTFREVKVHTQGEFGGLGIRIAVKDEWLTVITPMPGTPAYRLGILPEDKIIKIEGESTKGITVEEAVQKLRGQPGTEVNITVYREGSEPIDFKVIREIIKIQTVISKDIGDGIGYVRLIEFSEKTPPDLDRALSELSQKKIKSLILDMRNNPGGLLDSAVEVCKFFVGDEKLIVYTQGREAKVIRRFIADKTQKYPGWPMCVLINKGSASGSEIVAGCIKDHKRGILLGEKSFGKASVQSLIQLADGSAIRLTTAHYYTPNGILIHEKGVAPDIAIDVTREAQIKLMAQEEIFSPEEKVKEEVKENKDKNSNKAIVSDITSKTKDKEEKKEVLVDAVLERAKDILKAREIFFSE